jgi:hypothetical protein
VPGEALRRGTPPLSLRREVRLLACEFEVVSDCGELLRRLDQLVPRPIQPKLDGRRHQLAAWSIDGGYRLFEDGGPAGQEPDAAAAARTLFWRMQVLALDAVGEFSRLHAGCATWGGRRLVAAGATRSGKSTLMARLLYEGFDVHCDDLVLLRRGEALPYPRRFFIRPESMALIPQLAGQSGDPFEWGGWDPGSVAVDPSILGFEWRIEAGRVDTVLFLERDARGARLEACPKHAMAERLMFQSNPPAGGPGDWVRDVCALLDRADCFVLGSGDLEGSVSAVKDALNGGAA